MEGRCDLTIPVQYITFTPVCVLPPVPIAQYSPSSPHPCVPPPP